MAPIRSSPVMRSATVLADKGDAKGAVEAFDAVAADGSIPMSIRDMAPLARGVPSCRHTAPMPMSPSAPSSCRPTPTRCAPRRAKRLALSAWKEGKASDALKLFEQISNDDQAPQNARQRATLMAELIRGSGVKS